MRGLLKRGAKGWLPAFCCAVTFAWDMNTETNLAGYRLKGGPGERQWNVTYETRGTNFTVTNMPPGLSYWNVFAFDFEGYESDASNTVKFERVVLRISRAGMNVRVSWDLADAAFQLQQAETVSGPWFRAGPVTTNGMEVVFTSPIIRSKFFRAVF